ncbi:MAG: iron-sulfur cluster assembly scaffold protein [Spirochaetales bacterium]|nr:iron-sulfur cluster assembly scaffold protein [Spirochaetales bacterium]
MAKNNLLGGSLWEEYSDKVSNRMNRPEFMGDISEEEAKVLGGDLIVADYGAESCGDAVRLYWVVEPETNIIKAAKFKSFGCGTAIASSDVMAEMCIGKTVDEAVEITNLDVEAALRDNPDTPAVPPQKMHCSVMAYDVIKKAAATFKKVDMSIYEDADMVCECARVTLKTIKDVIRINDLTTVEEITNYTKAGAFCKSCIKPGGHEERKYYLVDILNETREEMAREQIKEQSLKTDFKSMNLIQKHKAVENVMAATIRPMLASDGGSVEVVDMKERNGGVVIYISYGGACASCASSHTGTLSGIQAQLRESLDQDIDVIPV